MPWSRCCWSVTAPPLERFLWRVPHAQLLAASSERQEHWTASKFSEIQTKGAETGTLFPLPTSQVGTAAVGCSVERSSTVVCSRHKIRVIHKSSVVILRSAFAGRRTYGFAVAGGAASQMHRSFVGIRPLRERIRFLRMTGGWEWILGLWCDRRIRVRTLSLPWQKKAG